MQTLRNSISVLVFLAGFLAFHLDIYADSEPDWDDYCLVKLDKKRISCGSGISFQMAPSAACTVEIKIKNRSNGEVSKDTLAAVRHGAFGMGVFNMLGVGLLIDGPQALILQNEARGKLDQLIETALENKCEE